MIDSSYQPSDFVAYLIARSVTKLTPLILPPTDRYSSARGGGVAVSGNPVCNLTWVKI